MKMKLLGSTKKSRSVTPVAIYAIVYIGGGFISENEIETSNSERRAFWLRWSKDAWKLEACGGGCGVITQS